MYIITKNKTKQAKKPGSISKGFDVEPGIKGVKCEVMISRQGYRNADVNTWMCMPA